MDKSLHDTLTGWRRHLHTHPELSGHEAETAAFVRRKLDELGIPYIADVGGHGIVATLSRPGSDRTVGLRADMDALPIDERTGADYASASGGVMHACGHDGHTVSLLGAAALLQRDPDWTGTIHLIFQPSEENGQGARAMVADPRFAALGIERIFAFHNWPGLEAGTVAVHDGPVMAEPGRFHITLEGLAGHAAKPQETRDPILAAGHLIVALQSLVSRNVAPTDAAVVSIGTVHAGTAPNQIPAEASLGGTFRTFRPEVRDLVIAGIRRIADGVAATFGLTARVEVVTGGRATVNTELEAEMAAQAAAAAGLHLRRDLPPNTTSEDFPAFLADRPGAYVWIGNGSSADLHNERYDFNDAILPATAGWLAAVARQGLRGDLANRPGEA